ncbi:MAG: tetratricopeptide repeat protein [Desulfobacterales bacterium]|nr:tetratricopeptide repeat protein [Desulfobacterales bacterium]
MADPCQYHPRQTAQWFCERCQIYLCPVCAIERDRGGLHAGEKIHLCAKCNLPVAWLGAGHLVEPFWRRLHRIFLYPFGVYPLILMVALALASIVFMQVGLIGLIGAILVWGVRVKYSYEALKYSARGDLRPPPLNARTIFTDFNQVFKQFAVFFFIGLGFIVVSTKLGGLFGVLFLIFVLVFLPAIFILLVATNSVVAALNPLLFVQLAIRIGWGYGLMYFFLILLYLAPGTLNYYILQYMPPVLHAFLVSMGLTYYSVVFYHLMGYVLLQYSDAIGYEVRFADFHDHRANAPAAPLTAVDQLQAQIDPMVKEGRLEEAVQTVRAAIDAGHINGEEMRAQHYKLLKAAGRLPEMAAEGQLLLEQYVKAAQKAEACQVYQDCTAAGAAFVVAPTLLMKLGSWLNASGHYQASIGAYNRLIKTDPASPLVPKAYFQAARVLHRGLGQTAKAQKIIQALIKKYPQHDIVPYAQDALRQMKKPAA